MKHFVSYYNFFFQMRELHVLHPRCKCKSRASHIGAIYSLASCFTAICMSHRYASFFIEFSIIRAT